MRHILVATITIITFFVQVCAQNSTKSNSQIIEVHKTTSNIMVDGIADDIIWQQSEWYSIDQLWLGETYTNQDFSGRYKLAWSSDALYILAEITDDLLLDQHKDPLKEWWNDDCLEIFVDEDNSGGNHQFNHNAFAYHIALDDNVVDMSLEKKGKLYNSHIESIRKTFDTTSIWEVKISLYNDTYNETLKNKPVNLIANKHIGFAIAYCDNDTSKERENFIGSIIVEGADKNRGWIDANIFGTLKLVGE